MKWRYSEEFRSFSEDSRMLSEGHKGVSEHLPKIKEDCRGISEDVSTEYWQTLAHSASIETGRTYQQTWRQILVVIPSCSTNLFVLQMQADPDCAWSLLYTEGVYHQPQYWVTVVESWHVRLWDSGVMRDFCTRTCSVICSWQLVECVSSSSSKLLGSKMN